MSEKKISELIEFFYKEARSPADMALYHLLNEHKDSMPPFDEYFHKAFRQTDVTDSGNIDMSIWYLIGESKLFWHCFNRVTGKTRGEL